MFGYQCNVTKCIMQFKFNNVLYKYRTYLYVCFLLFGVLSPFLGRQISKMFIRTAYLPHLLIKDSVLDVNPFDSKHSFTIRITFIIKQIFLGSTTLSISLVHKIRVIRVYRWPLLIVNLCYTPIMTLEHLTRSCTKNYAFEIAIVLFY